LPEAQAEFWLLLRFLDVLRYSTALQPLVSSSFAIIYFLKKKMKEKEK
jgi:hypothetical protein